MCRWLGRTRPRSVAGTRDCCVTETVLSASQASTLCHPSSPLCLVPVLPGQPGRPRHAPSHTLGPRPADPREQRLLPQPCRAEGDAAQAPRTLILPHRRLEAVFLAERSPSSCPVWRGQPCAPWPPVASTSTCLKPIFLPKSQGHPATKDPQGPVSLAQPCQLSKVQPPPIAPPAPPPLLSALPATLLPSALAEPPPGSSPTTGWPVPTWAQMDLGSGFGFGFGFGPALPVQVRSWRAPGARSRWCGGALLPFSLL